MTITLQQHGSMLESDLETPVGLFLRLVGEKHGILLESAEVDGRWGRHSIIATDFLLYLNNDAGNLSLDICDPRLQALEKFNGLPFSQGLRELLKELEIKPDQGMPPQPPITRGLYGYLGYGIASLLEPKLQEALPPGDATLGLGLPGTLIIFDHMYNRISQLSLLQDGNAPESATNSGKHFSTIPKNYYHAPTKPEDFVNSVLKAKELIRQGEVIQVVLSAHFQAPLKDSPFTLYRRLRRLNPSPYMFYMNLPGGALLGSSPEVMISCNGGQLRVCPIAGTRPRSNDAVEDAIFGDELLSDPKEQSEHVMLVDLGRNDLGRIAEPGSVKLERYMELERFSHVMHMTSRISASLRKDCDAVDIMSSSFPAGTVSGAPKIRAMRIIAELESRPRGPYAGAIGWIGLDKDAVHLDLGITIRSFWTAGDTLYWQAGAGIVFDSDPESEWKECRNKSAIMHAVINNDENKIRKPVQQNKGHKNEQAGGRNTGKNNRYNGEYNSEEAR